VFLEFFTTESTENTETEGEKEGLRISDPKPFFLSGLCALCASVVKHPGILRLSNRLALYGLAVTSAVPTILMMSSTGTNIRLGRSILCAVKLSSKSKPTLKWTPSCVSSLRSIG
jgi:hypothetical protein